MDLANGSTTPGSGNTNPLPIRTNVFSLPGSQDEGLINIEESWNHEGGFSIEEPPRKHYKVRYCSIIYRLFMQRSLVLYV